MNLPFGRSWANHCFSMIQSAGKDLLMYQDFATSRSKEVDGRCPRLVGWPAYTFNFEYEDLDNTSYVDLIRFI